MTADSQFLDLKLISSRNVSLIRPGYHLAKRALDIFVCLMALPFLLPIFLICALLIWLDDPGPVFFKQLRTGKGGARFRMYKFRTMVTNAEELKLKYAHLNELTWPDFKMTNDPRVTRVGRILRKTSLDEMPQIINVLKGDMSLVGPRPERPYFVEQLTRQIPFYAVRHSVKPGVTGWAQVRYQYGASVEDSQNKLQYDLYYVKNHSLLLDMRTLVETVRVVLTGQGAH